MAEIQSHTIQHKMQYNIKQECVVKPSVMATS